MVSIVKYSNELLSEIDENWKETIIFDLDIRIHINILW